MPMPMTTYGRTFQTRLRVERPGVAHPVLERQPHLDRPRATRLDLPDVGLDVALEVEAADDQAGHDRDDEAGDHVGEGDAGTEQAPQQHDRDLVDHRRGDEEGERDAERDAGLDEADEQRHRRAGAERRDDAEAGGGHRARQDAAAGERRPDALGRHERAQERDERDDPGQEQQDLGHVVQEEGDGIAELRALAAARAGRRRASSPAGSVMNQAMSHATTARRDGRPERQVGPADRERRHRRRRWNAASAAAQAASSRS